MEYLIEKVEIALKIVGVEKVTQQVTSHHHT